MLSNNKDNQNLDGLTVHPIQLPSDFHMPTDYETLCQLLEHNHQHHFKSINEMCYGCDKLNNNQNSYFEQEKEDLEEKIEHIQPQNHKHLCSLHALQFYPCLEDNMELIGELNTYANLDEKSLNIVENKPNIENGQKLNINLTSANDVLQQQNITINNLNQDDTLTALPNNSQENKNNLSMYIPSDYNNRENNESLLITNGHLTNLKENFDSSTKSIITNLPESKKETNIMYNVINDFPVNPVNNKSITYAEPIVSSDNLLNIENLNQSKQILTDPSSKSYEYILENKGTPDVTKNINIDILQSSVPLITDDKIPVMYTKSHSLPIYTNKDIPSPSTILNKNNTINTEIKSENSNESSSSQHLNSSINVPSTSSIFNINNSLLSSSLNQSINSLDNSSTSASSLSYNHPSSSINTHISATTFPNSSHSDSVSTIPLMQPPLLNSTNNTDIPKSSSILPKYDQPTHINNIIPQTKPIVTPPYSHIPRNIAPLPKSHPPKTYIKNTTIRTKPTAIDPEEKRRRNTEASARFRARKKFTEIMLKQQTHDLSCKCCELEKQLAEAKKEIYWLKQLLIAKQS